MSDALIRLLFKTQNAETIAAYADAEIRRDAKAEKLLWGELVDAKVAVPAFRDIEGLVTSVVQEAVDERRHG